MMPAFTRYAGLFFVLKCALIGGLMMLLSMAAGEIFVSPNLFGGFIHQPLMWLMILFESAMWLMPFLVVGVLLLRRLKGVSKKVMAMSAAGLWAAFGTFIVITYKVSYFPEDWGFQSILKAEVIFGWLIPCLLIWMFFTWFSVQYLVQMRQRSMNLNSSKK
jgi:hypothetical protein